MRDTLSLDPEEWEVLCLSICQQLALAYDHVYKGERNLMRESWSGSLRGSFRW